MHVQKVMTRETTSCLPTADLVSAAKSMSEGNFGILPVIDDRGKVIGIVTDRDICLAVARQKREPAHIQVRDIMTAPVVACFDTDDVRAALATMKKARVRRLPVLAGNGLLKGLVSMDDLILLATGQKDGLTSEAIVDAYKAICERRLVATAR